MGACPRRAGLISRIGELRHNTIVILAGEWTAKIRGGPMNERRVKRIVGVAYGEFCARTPAYIQK